MLSAEELVKELSPAPNGEERLTIVPVPDEQVLLKDGDASIDLRLGRWFRTIKQTSTNFIQLVKLTGNEEEFARSRQHFVPFGKKFTLHPGHFVLGATLEWLKLPKSLAAYISGKSSHGRSGLVIETAAGVHPCFTGCLTLELANVGIVPIQLYPGMSICQVFFHRVKPGSSDKRGKFSGQRKPTMPRPSIDPYLDALSFESTPKQPSE